MKKTDEQLQQDVIDELAAEGNLEGSTIGVAVKRGAVELLGTVPSFAEKNLANRVAAGVAGVRRVVNKLREAEERRPHATAR